MKDSSIRKLPTLSARLGTSALIIGLMLLTNFTANPVPYPDYLPVEVAIDEEFVIQVGDDWETEVYRMVEEGDSLLKEVGLELKVVSIQRWRSDNEEDSIEALLNSVELQIKRDPRHLLLAITCQDTAKYDGWAQPSKSQAIVKCSPKKAESKELLIAHEVGHLLGARHHEDEEECTEDGCIMGHVGPGYFTNWCQHHQQVIEEYIANRLTT